MSLRPEADFARHILLGERGEDGHIYSSDRTWELKRTVFTDDISPDLISDLVSTGLTTLLEQSALRKVALDWTSTQFRLHQSPGRTTQASVQVDTL